MWKNYIKTIKERDFSYTHQEYCIWFAGHFSYKIYPLQEYINILEKDNGDLLPISKNLTDFFYSMNIELLVNLIYHINELKILDFIIMDTNKNTNIDNLFFSRNNKIYFFNLFSFDTEILLSNEDDSASLLFLFFYFLPHHKNQDLLYHSRKKNPLISCNKISFNHFQMLLFLMKEYDSLNFQNLCSGYNLNLLLLEDFCQNTTEIYTFLDVQDWYKVLPIQKIKLLFKNKCFLNNFSQFQNKKVYYTVPTLSDFIIYFQKELEFLELKEKLTAKGQFSQKEKVVKI